MSAVTPITDKGGRSALTFGVRDEARGRIASTLRERRAQMLDDVKHWRSHGWRKHVGIANIATKCVWATRDSYYSLSDAQFAIVGSPMIALFLEI